MTTSRMILDARLRPELFHWNGRMSDTSLLQWLQMNQLADRCPDDLVAFWSATGGGDILESETILGPLGDSDMGDDMMLINREMRAGGMPARLLVFHTGMITTALDTEAGDYVELNRSDLHTIRRFSSLDIWYTMTIRKEYAARYGLPELGPAST